LNGFVTWIERAGPGAPWLFLLLFAAASFLMIWRLEAMSGRGVEGTVLGTLVMPYCSGIGNLLFVFVVARRGGPGAEVITNALVNNVTNLTLLIGLPTVLWGLGVMPAGRGGRASRAARPSKIHQLNRLSLLLTLLGAVFFRRFVGVGATQRTTRVHGWSGVGRLVFVLAMLPYIRGVEEQCAPGKTPQSDAGGGSGVVGGGGVGHLCEH